MAARETYPRYADYLHQSIYWPSESADSGLIKVADMVPRHAASAHAKLLRWTRTYESAIALNTHNLTARETHVRSSSLAAALINICQSWPATKPTETPAEVTPRDMILSFVPLIAEHTSLDIKAIFTLAEALATKADEDWTVTLPSR